MSLTIHGVFYEVVEIVKPLLLSLVYLKPDNLVDVVRARARGEETFE
jgi:hypothetical protein